MHHLSSTIISVDPFVVFDSPVVRRYCQDEFRSLFNVTFDSMLVLNNDDKWHQICSLSTSQMTYDFFFLDRRQWKREWNKTVIRCIWLASHRFLPAMSYRIEQTRSVTDCKRETKQKTNAKMMTKHWCFRTLIIRCVDRQVRTNDRYFSSSFFDRPSPFVRVERTMDNCGWLHITDVSLD